MKKDLNKENILSTLSSHQRDLEKFGVCSIGLFGSYVKNAAKDNSDVDLLVNFVAERKTLKNLIELADFLEMLFLKKVDIVTPQGLSKYIGPYILKEVQYAPFHS